MPAVNPVTVMGEVALEPEPPTGLEVTVKVVALAPNVAAVKATVAVVAPVSVAVPIVGAVGTATEATPLLCLIQ